MAQGASPKKKQLMLEGNIKTLIPSMALPPIIAQLVTKIYNLVDVYFVSTLGMRATAAVSVNGSMERAISMFGGLIGVGACSYVSRLLGEKRDRDADRVLSTAFFTSFGGGVLIAVIGLIFIGPFVKLLGANADSEQYAVDYATYVLAAAPMLIGTYVLSMSLRSEGSATYAMIGSASGGILNCFLDPLFIFTFNLGVAGASMATAVSKLFSFCILIFPYVRKRCAVSISLRKVKYVWKDTQEVLSIGSTSFLRSICSVVSSVIINHIAGAFSTAALAAVTVANQVMEFPFAIILGFSQGCQPIVGFNWGAKRLDRVRESLRISTFIAIAGSLLMGAILFAAANPVVSLFNKEGNLDVLRLGVLCARLQCVTVIFHSFDSVINMFYSGTGKFRCALLMSMARQGYCFLAVVLTVPFLFGSESIVACQAIADCLTMAVSIPLGIKAFRMVSRPNWEIEETA